MSARILTRLLSNPETAQTLAPRDWNGVISAARAERLLATLAFHLDSIEVPARVNRIFADARIDAERDRRIAVWEADRAVAALAPLDIPVILLKGAAYAAAGLEAGQGRMIGDLDILVPRGRLSDAEAALLEAGWEWVKPDPYDDAYYRQWMHELPPMIHRDRDRMIDVHHTILPLTARVRPDPRALLEASVALPGGMRILSPEDRVCHAVAHMLADGDLAGGLRNLWDINLLLGRIHNNDELMKRARNHGLLSQLLRASRLANHVYGDGSAPLGRVDRLFLARLLSRDGWGRDSRKWLGFVFYIRSHLLRMPPRMLIRHLWTKWRVGHRPI